MAPLTFTSRRSRQRVHNGAFVGTEVIFAIVFDEFFGELLGRH